MCKAKSKSRVFRAGIIAAVIVALAGLSACDGLFVLDDIAEQNAAAELPVVNPDGTVNVKVVLPDAGGGRSVADGLVQAYVDYYEVIFKVHGSTDPDDFYIGTAEDGKEYLSVAVEPDKSYDILLLAGTLSNRVLLATGFINNAAGNGYVPTDTSDPLNPVGVGYEVKANKPNTITFTMTSTNITVGVDLTVDNDGTDFTYSRPGGIATISEVDHEENTGNLKIKFAGTLKLVHLENAQLNETPSGATFASNKLTLSPLYTTDSFDLKVVGDTTKTEGVVYTYEIATGDLPSKKGNLRDVDGKLKWELQYFAFGNVNSKSSKWNIRNGLDYDIDDNGSGGSIRVKFGTGTPDLKKVIINY
jgi:hypothetical protein